MTLDLSINISRYFDKDVHSNGHVKDLIHQSCMSVNVRFLIITQLPGGNNILSRVNPV